MQKPILRHRGAALITLLEVLFTILVLVGFALPFLARLLPFLGGVFHERTLIKNQTPPYIR